MTYYKTEPTRMFGWLHRNKEWAFDRVEGMLLGALGALSLYRFRAFKNVTSSPPPFDQKKFLTRPLPKEIQNQINAAAPINRNNRAHEFDGLKVQWQTKLHDARRRGRDIRLMLQVSGYYHGIYINVNAEHYPDLKLAKRGTIIWVAGTIADCTKSGGIALRDVELRIVSLSRGVWRGLPGLWFGARRI